MAYWIYKVNSKQSNAEFNKRAYGEWQELYKDNAREQEWGGTWATGDPNSLRFLREEMLVGDLILSYQTDLRSILGLGRITKLDRFTEDTGNIGVKLYMKAHEAFRVPVPILRLKREDEALAAIRAFQPNSLGSLHAITEGEAEVLLKACRDYQKPL